MSTSTLSPEQRLATLQRIHDLRKFIWVCARPLCDGMPHPGMPHRHARQAQRFPTGSPKGWALIAGRGFGKTRTGAEWAKDRMLKDPKHRLAIIAPDFGAGRDICVEGESGLLSILPEDRIKHWNRSMGELVLANGAQAKIFGTNTVSDADSLRGPQHHCFVAGTLIQTERGPVPIEQVQVGERVYTRAGLRRVYAAGSRQAEVIDVVVAGMHLTGTPDHPVWTENRGWVDLSSVQVNDTIIAWSGERTSAAGTTATPAGASTGATAGPGSRPTARSLTAGRSTTSTATRATTGWPTWWRSLQRITSAFTPMSREASPAPTAPWCSPTLVEVDPRSAAPSAPQPSASSGSARPTSDAAATSSSAPSAARSSAPGQAPSARCGASTSGATSTAEVTVYNLSVEDLPEFFANGLLVHNSIWAEEISSWRHQQYAWDMALMGLRLGTPMWCATTTPKPQALIKEFLADPDVVKSSGSTFDNADNLAETFLAEMRRKYEGTRLGQQELYAAFIEDIDGALWTREAIEADRITPDDCPAMERIVVAIDPAATSNDQSDETGLAVVGQKGEHFYVLADLSGVFTPGEWSAKAVEAFHAYGADRIIGEANNGGDMIEHAIRQAPGGRNVAYRKVTATRGKALRAEPVQALYEQHRVHHLPYGDLKHLEDQMCTWVPGDKTSPDRLDALVWGLTDLAFGKRRATLSYGGAR